MSENRSQPPAGTERIAASARVESAFARVVCGVDERLASLEAVRQVAQLAPPESEILLVNVVDPGHGPTRSVAALVGEVSNLPAREREIVARIRSDLAGTSCTLRIAQGDPIEELLATAGDHEATLLAVGIHERSRVTGILSRRVATELLHRAPCSILVARHPRAPDTFPRGLTVGFDGSDGAGAALEVALALGRRLQRDVRVLVALGGAQLDLDEVGSLERRVGTPALLEDARGPVEALTAVETDLLVLGSRGASGVRALGSVSERVAHQATASVLVVR